MSDFHKTIVVLVNHVIDNTKGDVAVVTDCGEMSKVVSKNCFLNVRSYHRHRVSIHTGATGNLDVHDSLSESLSSGEIEAVVYLFSAGRYTGNNLYGNFLNMENRKCFYLPGQNYMTQPSVIVVADEKTTPDALLLSEVMQVSEILDKAEKAAKKTVVVTETQEQATALERRFGHFAQFFVGRLHDRQLAQKLEDDFHTGKLKLALYMRSRTPGKFESPFSSKMISVSHFWGCGVNEARPEVLLAGDSELIASVL